MNNGGKTPSSNNASNRSMKKPATATPDQLKFTFQKSSSYRVLKVDGVWGGLTPKSEVQMAIYSERLPIPDTQVIEIDDEGRVRTLKQTGTTKGLIREVEATLCLPPQVARSVGQWLIDRANEFDRLVDSIPDDQLQKAFEQIRDVGKNK